MDEYCDKLVRVLVYINRTPEECFMLSMDDNKLIKWWVDVSYDINGDMRNDVNGKRGPLF